MFCSKCKKRNIKDVAFCKFCGSPMEKRDKPIKEKVKEHWKIALIIIIVVIFLGLYFLFVFDIGLNSKYFVRRDFNDAFFYRKTGNCSEFKSYLVKDIENWGERCIKEKDGNKSSIINFSIKDISISGKSAFLQVELEREPTMEMKALEAKGEIKDFDWSYAVNYTMQKQNYKRLLFIFPKTRWFIENEIR